MNKANLQEIQRNIVQQSDLKNPPIFEPQNWESLMEAGCYPYALNLKVDQFFRIGALIDVECNAYVSDELLTDVLKIELKRIFGYAVEEVEDANAILEEGEKLICLQREKHTGHYHLLRRDADGIWSHKMYGELPIRYDSKGREIKNPSCMYVKDFKNWYFLLRKED